MRIHTKLIIQTCILVLLATTLFFVYVRLEFKKTVVLFQGQKSEIESVFDKILEFKSKPLEALAVDYTYWDEFVNYIKNPNQAWAEQNLKTTLPTFDVDLLIVYNSRFLPVTHFTSESNEDIYGEFSQKVNFAKVFEQKRVRHFFAYSTKGILEVYGASVHPTNDPERKTDPKGYMFAVRLWGKEYTDEISKITDCQMEIIYPFARTTFANKVKYREEAIQFSRALRGWSDSPIVRIDVTRLSSNIIEFKSMSRQEMFILLFFVLFIAVIYIRFILLQVHNPLALISKSLKENNLQHIIKMQSGNTEFSEIARLIFKLSENEIQLAEEVNLLKITESQLEKERDRVQEYLDIAGVMIVILDRKGNISLINKKGCAILGYENQEIMGSNWFQTCLQKENREEVFGVFEKVISGDTDFKEYYENQVLRKDGQLRMVAFHNAVLKNKMSQIIGILFSGEDITEREKMELGLQESEKRFRGVLYASEDAILLIDNQKFVDCNEATVKMLGYSSRDEFLKHPAEVSPPIQPDGRNSFDKANEMMKIASEKGFHRFEWMHRKSNGEDFPVEVSLTPVSFQGKSILHCVWRDITELKQAEQELKEDLHDLEVFYKASIGREERILELKKQVKELELKLGNVKQI